MKVSKLFKFKSKTKSKNNTKNTKRKTKTNKNSNRLKGGGGSEALTRLRSSEALTRLISFINSLSPKTALEINENVLTYENSNLLENTKYLNYFDIKIILLYIVAYKLVDDNTLAKISELFRKNYLEVLQSSYIQSNKSNDTKSTLKGNRTVILNIIYDIIKKILPLNLDKKYINFINIDFTKSENKQHFESGAFRIYLRYSKTDIIDLLGKKNYDQFIKHYFNVFNSFGKIEDISISLNRLQTQKLNISNNEEEEDIFYNSTDEITLEYVDRIFNEQFLKLCKLLINMTNASNKVLDFSGKVLGVSGNVSGRLKIYPTYSRSSIKV